MFSQDCLTKCDCTPIDPVPIKPFSRDVTLQNVTVIRINLTDHNSKVAYPMPKPYFVSIGYLRIRCKKIS